jgi:hypothetical protein
MGYLGDLAGGDLRVAFYLVPVCYLALAAMIGFDGAGRNKTGGPLHADRP